MAPTIKEILARLVAFPTLSRHSNLELLEYVEGLLAPAGVRLERFASEDATQANLLASIGPEGAGGVMLSGHCDVVPVEGQTWASDPYVLREEDGKLYGRGTADMKGFVAVAIHTMLEAARKPLAFPLHLALSYDEEIGCVGVRGMLDTLHDRPERPAFCIVGEPTGMRIAAGHKGKRSFRATCIGREGHSALAPEVLNALHLGAEFIASLQAKQDALEANGGRDEAYDVPYSTVHVGTMRGGTALNIVPARCELDFEIRNVAADDPETIVADLVQGADAVAAPCRERFPEAAVEIEPISGYPGLDIPVDTPAVTLVQSLLGHEVAPFKVVFGTEAGLFQQELAVPTLVCGPGHMAQGHKPDEFVEEAQLDACAQLLGSLTDRLVEGTDAALGPVSV